MGNFWDLMFRHFLTPMIGAEMTVLDLGAGNCEFINRVQARRRIVVDLNPDIRLRADPGVEVLLTSADDLHHVPKSGTWPSRKSCSIAFTAASDG